jgi:hypothetical protein
MAVVIISVLFSAFFTFDLTDEGFNLIVSKEGQPLGWALNYYAKFIGFLEMFVPLGPVELRLIRFGTHLLCSWVFSDAVVKLLRKSGKDPRTGDFSLILLVSFSAYLVFPHSLTYNSITYNLVQLACALVFYDVIAEESPLFNVLARNTLLGFIPVVLIYVKLTSAILLFFLIAAGLGFSILLKQRKTTRQVGWGWYILVVASVVLFLELQTQVVSFSEIVKKAALVSSLESSHDPLKLLVALLRFLAYVLFAFVVGYTWGRYLRHRRGRSLAFSILGTALLIWVTSSEIPSHALAMYFLAGTLILLGLFFFNAKHSEWRVAVYWFWTSAFLFLATLSVFAGTNNSNFLSFAPNMGIFLPSFLFLTRKTRVSFLFHRWYPVAMATVIAVTLIVFPYRQPPLWTMSHPLEVPLGVKPLVDHRLAKFVQNTNDHLVELGYEKDDPVFGIYRMPGLVYLLEGYAPGGILWKPEQNEAFFYYLRRDSLKFCEPCFAVFRDESEALGFIGKTTLKVTGRKRGKGSGVFRLEGQILPERLR